MSTWMLLLVISRGATSIELDSREACLDAAKQLKGFSFACVNKTTGETLRILRDGKVVFQ